ncbi:hypothetical protein FRC04_009993, partial [Tulasnella sp. 424]
MRSGKEYSCYVVPLHEAFDLDALNNRDVGSEEDVTIESEDFIVCEVEAGAEREDKSEDESKETPLGIVLPTQSPVPEELTDGGERSLAALQRNRNKKRKRRDPTGEEA